MIPVDRAGSVTEMKLVSVHMVTFSPLPRLKICGDATIQACNITNKPGENLSIFFV